jgi:hypothetical protein
MSKSPPKSKGGAAAEADNNMIKIETLEKLSERFGGNK